MHLLFFSLLFFWLGWVFYNYLNPFCYMLRYDIIFGFRYVLFSLGILIYESPQSFKRIKPLRTLIWPIHQKANINSFHSSRIQRNYKRTYHKTDASHNDQGESRIIDLTLIFCNQYYIGDKDSEGSDADFNQNTKDRIQKRNNRCTEHLLNFQTEHIDRRMAVLPSKQIYISISPTV